MKFQFRYRFEAAHRFLNSSSAPCMTPHGHTWYATLELSSIDKKLDSANMVMEFSKVKSSWKKFITETMDHSYMCNHQDPLIEPLLVANSQARLLRFPGDPTTEIIALFLFEKAEQLLKSNAEVFKKLQVSSIKIEETPTNSIICEREFHQEMISSYRSFKGWWQSEDVTDRSFSHE